MEEIKDFESDPGETSPDIPFSSGTTNPASSTSLSSGEIPPPVSPTLFRILTEPTESDDEEYAQYMEGMKSYYLDSNEPGPSDPRATVLSNEAQLEEFTRMNYEHAFRSDSEERSSDIPS